MAPTLKYFNIGGRADMIRIALHHSGIAWSDHRFSSMPEWEEAKKMIPGKAVPAMDIEGKTYTQSNALLRWAGKKATPPLYPEDDLKALRCDEIMDVCQDVLTQCPKDKDEEVKKTKRAEYAEGKMKVFFEQLAGIADENPGGYINGDFSIADLSVLALLDMIRSGSFDHVDKNYADTWPSLSALEKKIKEAPPVVKYYADKPPQ
jgi:glutathione S-transferase